MTDYGVGDRIRGYVRGLVPRSLEGVAPGLAAVIHHEGGVRRDLVAGVTVGAVAVPASLAMAELAGLPVVYGLYATFLPLAVYGLLGSSRQHVIGPDATIAALTAVTIAPLATVDGKVDPALYAVLAAALALAVGAVLLLAGVLQPWIRRRLLRQTCAVGIHQWRRGHGDRRSDREAPRPGCCSQ